MRRVTRLLSILKLHLFFYAILIANTYCCLACDFSIILSHFFFNLTSIVLKEISLHVFFLFSLSLHVHLLITQIILTSLPSTLSFFFVKQTKCVRVLDFHSSWANYISIMLILGRHWNRKRACTECVKHSLQCTYTYRIQIIKCFCLNICSFCEFCVSSSSLLLLLSSGFPGRCLVKL